jgi:hypothetical protein
MTTHYKGCQCADCKESELQRDIHQSRVAIRKRVEAANPFASVEFAPRVIEVKRFGSDGTWHARADWTGSEWIPMPLFGPATFDEARNLLMLQEANRGYSVVEVK